MLENEACSKEWEFRKKIRNCIVHRRNRQQPNRQQSTRLVSVPSCSCHVYPLGRSFNHTLNHLSTWSGIIANWCTLAAAGLGAGAVNSLSHLVNTFATRINVHYFASVKGPSVPRQRHSTSLRWQTFMLLPA